MDGGQWTVGSAMEGQGAGDVPGVRARASRVSLGSIGQCLGGRIIIPVGCQLVPGKSRTSNLSKVRSACQVRC